MATTTTYGNWTTVVDRFSAGFEHGITEALGDHGGDFDIAAIAADYHQAINEALPPGVTLNGDEFYGPAHAADQQFAGYPHNEHGELDIKAIIDSIDFWAIVAKHDPDA
ncbi:hypothetical protein [Polymorphospora sp. NPDC050346]|uniref:hypothetical protein n=1 Tax=Polymorphospora sp. NPDC050346 TaxID=3155780 RepID=UPI0033FDFD74